MTAVTIYADGSLITIKGEGYEPEGGFYDENERPIEIEDYPEAKLLLLGATLCNDARLEKSRGEKTWRMVGDPTEGALVVAAAKAGLWKEELEERWPRVAEVPFDSMRKRMTTVHKIPMTDDQIPIINDSITKSLFLPKSRISRAKSILSEIRLNSEEKIGHWSSDIGNYSYVAFVKGAPDVVLELCTRIAEDGGEWELSEKARERILEKNASLASNALRVLGVAYRLLEDLPTNPTAEGLEKDLTFIGLIGMIDPARPEVKDAIEVARRAGIKTVMVTGDYPNTAIAIAKELELLSPKGRVLVGTELDKLDDGTFASIVEEVEIYARVSPQHKVRIVEALKKRGHVVAMTGDGINDAPALKRASIGVAMGITGTDVTKETADMVLMDDNYASIVSAIEEGRVIYSNIRKFVYYLLSCNLGEIMTIFLATLRGWASPLSAIQLLWVNLVTDGAPALALGLEKGEPDIMELPPRPTKEPVINRKMTLGIAFQTIAITFATLAAYAIGLARFPEKARTMAFVTLSLSELLRAYTSRSERHSIFSIGVLSNKYMQLAVIASFSLLLAVVYLPFLRPIFDTLSLGLREWIAILPLLLIPAIIAEMMKFFLRGAWLTRRSSA
jgi:Ca2+-transporting ATPase